MLRLSTVVLILVLGCVSAWGQVEIFEVSQQVGEGENITIFGSGFGEKPQAAPVRWDDFQEGIPGSIFSGGDEPGWTISFLPPGDECAPRYTTSFQRWAGDISCCMSFGPRVLQYQNKCRADLSSPLLGNLFFSGWFYVDYTGGIPEGPATVRLVTHGNDISQVAAGFEVFPNQGAEAGRIFSWPCSGVGMPRYSPGGGLAGTGAWHRIEFWHGFDSGGETETVSLEMDGQPFPSMTGVNPGCELSMVSILPLFQDGGNEIAMDFHWSEWYVDNIRSRVELGNDPDFESCSHREIQVPVSWSEGEIQATVHMGSFVDEAALYLFVVTEDGTSSGFPISSDSAPGIVPKVGWKLR